MLQAVLVLLVAILGLGALPARADDLAIVIANKA